MIVVEDNEVEVEGLRRALRRSRFAHRLHVARDGVEALQLLRGDAPRPNLVLLDLSLPRMNGLELLAALRGDAALHDTVVIVYTTSDDAADLDRAWGMHVAAYVVKGRLGGDLEPLVDLLERYCALSTLPRGAA